MRFDHLICATTIRKHCHIVEYGVINLSEVVLFTFLGSFLHFKINFVNIKLWSGKFYKQFTNTCISPINPYWWCHFDVICHLSLNSNPGYLSSIFRLHHLNNSYNEQDVKGHYFDLGHWLRILEKLPQLATKHWSPNIHIQILQTDFHTFPWRLTIENC